MPQIKKVGNKIRYSVERFDGGLNTNDAPSKILPNESPDCYNVVFDRDGAVRTRNGSYYAHTTHLISTVTWNTALGSASYYQYSIDDAASYNDQVIVWATARDHGWTDAAYDHVYSKMFYSPTGSAPTYVYNTLSFTEVTAACGFLSPDSFGNGTRKPSVVYQDLLFFSDGTRAWKYGGGEKLYHMGISYDNTAPVVATTTSNGTQLNANTYYYAVSHENTQVVEGQIGSISAGVTVPASGSVKITGIPVPAAVEGINQKYVYRGESASGPFRRLTSMYYEAGASGTTGIATALTPDATAVFDNTPVGQEGRLAILDGTAPPAFSTIALHKERLFFNDLTADALGNTNLSTLRWSNFLNPFVSEVENFDVINNGDGEYISAILPQDDVLTIFKQSSGWGIVCTDPSDQLTWAKKQHPANIGLYSPYSAVKVQNGIFFLGRAQNKVTGFHFLSGLQIIESYDGKLRSLTASKKIEPTLFDLLPPVTPNSAQLLSLILSVPTSDQFKDFSVSIAEFKNKIYLSFINSDADGERAKIIWFDLNRLNVQDPDGIGSWSLWSSGFTRKIFTHSGGLYSASSEAALVNAAPTVGTVIKHELEDEFNDSGVAIDSYYFTKEYGGTVEDPNEASIESYFKDLRDIYIWYQQLGDYQFNIKVRRDGDEGSGQTYKIGMTGDTVSAWGYAIWGTSTWGDSLIGSATDRLSVGGLMGRRFQFRFDNQNTVNQGFQINRLEMDFNIRRRR
jgi:hypothetical protein